MDPPASPNMIIVTVRLDVVGEPERGLWCDDCALPSVLAYDVVMSNSATLRPMGRARYEKCYDCGQSRWPEMRT